MVAGIVDLDLDDCRCGLVGDIGVKSVLVLTFPVCRRFGTEGAITFTETVAGIALIAVEGFAMAAPLELLAMIAFAAFSS